MTRRARSGGLLYTPSSENDIYPQPMKVLTCKDFGIDCPAEFRGASVDEVLAQAKRHGMEQHGQTQEQVDADEVRKIAEERTRDER